MSDAAPAKAQKTERSGTPHRGRFDQKAKGQNKRGHHIKVGCAAQTAAHLRCCRRLATAHPTRLAPRPAQGNQSNAASARRSIDACAQVRRALTVCEA